MRLSRWGCAAVLAVVSASATAPAAIPATAQTKTTMRVAFTSDIDSLNPFRATTQVATQIGRLMYEFLTVNGAKDFLAGTGVGGALGDLERQPDLDIPTPQEHALVG